MSGHSRRKKEDPLSAGMLLAKAIGRREVFERLEARQVTKRWQEAVGEPLASKSVPEKFEHGVLTVAVTSAPWAQELRLRKAELLLRLNETAGRELFADLKFSVRQPEKQVREVAAQRTFEPEDVDVDVSIPEIREVVTRALGRLKAASKRSKT
jgi:predicted nucleic acid-binding Zn ribbon protein